MAKITDTQEAYENLANAIIKSAVMDYKSALIRLKHHPESETAKRDVERQEKFFYSDWYAVLTNLDGSYLVRKVKELVEECDGKIGKRK